MAPQLARLLATASVILAHALSFADAQGSKPVFAHFMVWFTLLPYGNTHIDIG
jgi:hypothetical protein